MEDQHSRINSTRARVDHVAIDQWLWYLLNVCVLSRDLSPVVEILIFLSGTLCTKPPKKTNKQKQFIILPARPRHFLGKNRTINSTCFSALYHLNLKHFSDTLFISFCQTSYFLSILPLFLLNLSGIFHLSTL